MNEWVCVCVWEREREREWERECTQFFLMKLDRSLVCHKKWILFCCSGEPTFQWKLKASATTTNAYSIEMRWRGLLPLCPKHKTHLHSVSSPPSLVSRFPLSLCQLATPSRPRPWHKGLPFFHATLFWQDTSPRRSPAKCQCQGWLRVRLYGF